VARAALELAAVYAFGHAQVPLYLLRRAVEEEPQLDDHLLMH
jgi:hypothetical protein